MCRLFLDRHLRHGEALSRLPPRAANNLVPFWELLQKRQHILPREVPLLSAFFFTLFPPLLVVPFLLDFHYFAIYGMESRAHERGHLRPAPGRSLSDQL